MQTHPTPNLDRLDLFLNARLAASTSDDDARRWWDVKVAAKRRLAVVPAEDVECVARELLEGLTKGAA